MSLDPFKSCRLGKRTVIFGRNGSGKTTLSESMRTTEAPIRYLWVDTVMGPNAQIMVFNRFYVQETLAEFVEGDGSAAAILKVGEVNVRLAREESLQVEANERNRKWAEEAREELRRIENQRSATLQRLKTSVINTLNSRDEVRFNSQSYTIRQVKAALARVPGEALAQDAFATACEVVGVIDSGARVALPILPSMAPKFHAVTIDLLEYNPIASTIDSIVSDNVLARWVEQGLSLHGQGDKCKFCEGGVVTQLRLEELRAHFSDDLASFRSRLQAHSTTIRDHLISLNRWEAALPDARSFVPPLRDAASDELSNIETRLVERRSALTWIEQVMDEVKADPFAPRSLDVPDVPIVDSANLDTVISANNKALDSLDVEKRRAITAIEDHLVSSDRVAYRGGFERAERLTRLAERLERSLSRGISRARSLRAEQQDTTAMAAEIDADLRAHFGHAHLAVTATTDGKGYVVERNGTPARTLSEGERNAVALSYFLQSLHGADVALSSATVVIDDPITSLDREAMFAAFALIEERTEKAGQLVVLTHDFEYFRLLLKSFSNRWDKSQKRIRAGDSVEAAFPAVSVLEARSVGIGDVRSTEIHPMPPVLVQRASEYHYLFWRIAQGARGGDSSNLPILGNAARRLVEGFISFKAPHGTTFQDKIDHVRSAYGVDAILARRVVKFLHGHSHREELRPTSAIDFPSVEAELNMVMEFIHSADGPHYKDMCKATEVENVFA